MNRLTPGERSAFRHRQSCAVVGPFARGLGVLLPPRVVTVDGPQTRGDAHPEANVWRCSACGWFKWRRVA